MLDPDLKSSISDLYQAKQESKMTTVHAVIGNEACDLDSAASCLIMFHTISRIAHEMTGIDQCKTLYIPCLNITRDQLDSRSEVVWFLEKTNGVGKTFLTCKDDIDWKTLQKNKVELLFTLVDHNYNEEFEKIGRIVEIVDHHQIQNPQWLLAKIAAGLRLTLDTAVGSCTTLVAERMLYLYNDRHAPEEILHLVYGSVLLDTINFNEKAKRFTKRDLFLFHKVDALLGPAKRPVRDQLYKQLVEVKNTIKELNFSKLMKRDLKVFKDKNGRKVAIASLFGMEAKEALGLTTPASPVPPLPRAALAADAADAPAPPSSADAELDTFFRENDYEALVIMGLIANSDHSDSISRDLVLIARNERLFEQLSLAFEQDTSKLDLVSFGSDYIPDPEDLEVRAHHQTPRLVSAAAAAFARSLSITDSIDLESGTPANTYKVKIWIQRNVTSSRKVVAPLVLKVLHDEAEQSPPPLLEEEADPAAGHEAGA